MIQPNQTLRAAFATLGILLLPGLAAGAPAQSRLEGTIRDASGEPVPDCRVIARAAAGTEIYVSPPSDDQGHYVLDVPGNAAYVLAALIAPTGTRVELTESRPLPVGQVSVTHDITIPTPVASDPRGSELRGASVDRLFLAFAEDPAMARNRYFEVQVDYQDIDFGDSTVVRGIVALQFDGAPKVELGARLGFGDRSLDGVADGSGPTDLDLWGKFHLYRSSDSRTDVAMGSIVTLPTGDPDVGLGQDAFQSKVFVGVSRTWASALFVAHAGVATAEDGEIYGVALDGKVAPAAAVGLLVPFTPVTSAVFEANYEGERFDGANPAANLLAGVNWRLRENGKLRLAVAVGLGETADLAQIVAGYAFNY